MVAFTARGKRHNDCIWSIIEFQIMFNQDVLEIVLMSYRVQYGCRRFGIVDDERPVSSLTCFFHVVRMSKQQIGDYARISGGEGTPK